MQIKLTPDGSSKFKGSWKKADSGTEKFLPLSDTISAEELIDIFVEKNPPSGFLPAAIRWLSLDGKFVIFERPPHYRDIKVSRALYGSKGEPEIYRVPIPWTVYSFSWAEDSGIDNLHVFLSDGPIQDVTTPLYMLPILNLNHMGKVCTPKAMGFSFPDLAAAVNGTYSMFWNSKFNLDLFDAQSQYYKTVKVPVGSFIKRPNGDCNNHVEAEVAKHVFPSFKRSEIMNGFWSGKGDLANGTKAIFSRWAGSTIEEVLSAQKIAWRCYDRQTFQENIGSLAKEDSAYAQRERIMVASPSLYSDRLLKHLGLKASAKPCEQTYYNNIFGVAHLIINNGYDPLTGESLNPPTVVKKLKQLLIKMS